MLSITMKSAVVQKTEVEASTFAASGKWGSDDEILRFDWHCIVFLAENRKLD